MTRFSTMKSLERLLLNLPKKKKTKYPIEQELLKNSRWSFLKKLKKAVTIITITAEKGLNYGNDRKAESVASLTGNLP